MYQKRRYEVSNGVLLHESVHIEFHRLYGPHTTTEQFNQFCRDHYNITVFPWETSKESMDALTVKFENKQDMFHAKFIELAKSRNYEVLGGRYENKKSKYTLYCPKHDETHVVTPQAFNRAIYGMQCCAKDSPNLKNPRCKQT
jgi:hypothetical protein